MQHTLVVATTNKGKLEELRAMLESPDLCVLSLADVTKRIPEIVEDGKTFADNALKKAREVAKLTSCLTLADDSGLEVDILNGAPGVRSARFAHERATDAENNAALLAALEGVAPAETRGERPTARFRCVLALIDPFSDAEPHVVEGVCEGSITSAPRGSFGFGYDPMFVVHGLPDGREPTMAELTDAEKNQISHRAKAWQKLRLVLEKVIAARNERISRILG
jgi:XTP/dITP diphosphohydrolase